MFQNGDLSNTELNGKVVIFLHIPKAAGMTLNHVLKRQFRPGDIYGLPGRRSHHEMEEFRRLPVSRKRHIRVLTGHMHFGLHESIPAPATYITIMREPIERMISHYYYVLREPKHYLYKEVVSKRMSFEEYACNGISPELDNGQTKAISGLFTESGQCTEEAFDLAKKNIEQHFALVGLAERFDETALLLRKIFDWGMPFYMRENCTPNRPARDAFSAKVLARVAEHNEYDIRLYEFAKARFEQVCAWEAEFLNQELPRFQVLNKYYRRTRTLVRAIRHHVNPRRLVTPKAHTSVVFDAPHFSWAAEGTKTHSR